MFGSIKNLFRIIFLGNGSENTEEKKPTPEDLKKSALYAAVFKMVLTHPWFLIPLAVGGIFALVGLFFGGALWWIATGFCAIVSASAGMTFFARVQHYANQHLQYLKNLKARQTEKEVQDYAGLFRKLGFTEGVKAAFELYEEHVLLQQFLKDNAGEGLEYLNIERFGFLAEEIVENASVLLKGAEQTYRVLQTLDPGKLNFELSKWRKEKTSFEKEDASGNSVKIKALDRKIASHEERLAIYKQSDNALHAALAKVEELEGMLEKNRLNLTRLLIAGQTRNISDENVAEFEREVRIALRIDERQQRQSEQDAMYEKLGTKTKDTEQN